VVVTDPLTRRSGDPVPCGLGHCTLVALSSDGAVLARQALSFGVPTLTADRTDGLLDEQIVGLTLSGLDPDSAYAVGLCVPPGSDGVVDCGHTVEVVSG